MCLQLLCNYIIIVKNQNSGRVQAPTNFQSNPEPQIVKHIPERLQVVPVLYMRDIKKNFNDMAALHYQSI